MRNLGGNLDALKTELSSGDPLLVGRSLTKCFGLIILALALLPQKTTSGWNIRFIEFIISPSNEIGDTLAGIAGVLAFLWIIITVWLQSKELHEQRKELAATREELKLTRQTQQKQLELLTAQGDIFKDESKYREEARAKATLEELFVSLDLSLTRANSNSWETMQKRRLEFIEKLALEQARESGNSKIEKELTALTLTKYQPVIFDPNMAIERRYWSAANTIEAVTEKLCSMSEDGFPKRPNRTDYDAILKTLVEIGSVEKLVSRDQRIRIGNLDLPRLFKVVQLFLAQDFWSTTSEIKMDAAK